MDFKIGATGQQGTKERGKSWGGLKSNLFLIVCVLGLLKGPC